MLKNRLEQLVNELDGEAGIVVKNLATGEELFTHNADSVCASASVIKIPVLLELIDQHASGTFDIYAIDEVTEPDVCVGAGVIRHLGVPNKYSWLDYATLMIILSDNVATNKIIKRIGFDAVNNKIKEIGAPNTVLQRIMFDLKAREEGRENLTNARDMQIIMEYIYDNSERYALALDMMERQLINDKLPSLIEPPIRFAHKTGELDGIRHDVGIMYLDAPILVSVICQKLKSDLEGTLFHGQVGKAIWEELSNK